MASSAGRTLRSASRLILQAASSQSGRIASQAGSPKLQTVRALHQAAGISLARQAQRTFSVSISRTASACAMMSTAASPVSTCGSLLCTGSSSDMMEVSASEDEGLVIEAPEKLDDL
ncbi:uncharacterized protein [Pocillopora verrucosa]|uniref:uncharacterized protein isoform X1 n=1 Tax=Pocillopora verrucosa TaxID=203993 RepID=UPI00333FD96D